MAKKKVGWFGDFGGQFAPETLMEALSALEAEYSKIEGTLRLGVNSITTLEATRGGLHLSTMLKTSVTS